MSKTKKQKAASNPSRQVLIKAALKRVLKSRGVGYSELATLWQCSLVTVKRAMGAEDLSLDRLLLLLDFLDLSLVDLEELMKQSTEIGGRLTSAQTKFLKENPHFLAFLLRLYDHETPQQIAQSVGMTKLHLERYLILLEKNELITVSRGGQVRPRYQPMFELGGELGEVHLSSLLSAAAKYFSSVLIGRPKGSRGHGSVQIVAAEMTPESIQHFTDRLRILISDLFVVSEREKKIFPASQLQKVVLSCMHHKPEANEPNLKLVERPFGEVLAEIEI